MASKYTWINSNNIYNANNLIFNYILMEWELKEVIEWWLCPIVTEDGAKKILGHFYNTLSNSRDKKNQERWKHWLENLDVLAKNYVKWMCQGILENEEKQN